MYSLIKTMMKSNIEQEKALIDICNDLNLVSPPIANAFSYLTVQIQSSNGQLSALLFQMLDKLTKDTTQTRYEDVSDLIEYLNIAVRFNILNEEQKIQTFHKEGFDVVLKYESHGVVSEYVVVDEHTGETHRYNYTHPDVLLDKISLAYGISLEDCENVLDIKRKIYKTVRLRFSKYFKKGTTENDKLLRVMTKNLIGRSISVGDFNPFEFEGEKIRWGSDIARNSRMFSTSYHSQNNAKSCEVVDVDESIWTTGVSDRCLIRTSNDDLVMSFPINGIVLRIFEDGFMWCLYNNYQKSEFQPTYLLREFFTFMQAIDECKSDKEPFDFMDWKENLPEFDKLLVENIKASDV